jgi:hypothetical protein
VDPVPDPLLLRKSGSAGNRTRTSGSVARNSDHQTTEAVVLFLMPVFIVQVTKLVHFTWCNIVVENSTRLRTWRVAPVYSAITTSI